MFLMRMNFHGMAGYLLVGGSFSARGCTSQGRWTTTGVQMKALSKLSQFVAAITLAGAMAAPAMANIVTNGGFEAGETGWTNNGWSVVNADRGIHSGVNSMGTGCVDAGFSCTFGQTLSTVAGQRYDISFWLYSDGIVVNGNVFGQSPNGLRVWFDGAIVDTIIDFPTTNTGPDFYPGGPSTLVTINGAVASGTSALLQFGGYHLPSAIFMDDISVVASNVVPEPGSIALVGLALLGPAATRRGKR
jgi:PEP-CTERM motif